MSPWAGPPPIACPPARDPGRSWRPEEVALETGRKVCTCKTKMTPGMRKKTQSSSIEHHLCWVGHMMFLISHLCITIRYHWHANSAIPHTRSEYVVNNCGCMRTQGRTKMLVNLSNYVREVGRSAEHSPFIFLMERGLLFTLQSSAFISMMAVRGSYFKVIIRPYIQAEMTPPHWRAAFSGSFATQCCPSWSANTVAQ